MKSLIIGAAGFVGEYLINELLSFNDEVYATKLANENIKASSNVKIYDLESAETPISSGVTYKNIKRFKGLQARLLRSRYIPGRGIQLLCPTQRQASSKLFSGSHQQPCRLRHRYRPRVGTQRHQPHRKPR